jgi:Fe-S cluster assembly iron-binding protein IscA
MLELTSRAVATLAYARWLRGLPEQFSVRVVLDATGKTPRFQVSFAEEPEEGDAVGEAEGMRVFVASGIAEPLADYVLDADEEGGIPGLVLRRRSPSRNSEGAQPGCARFPGRRGVFVIVFSGRVVPLAPERSKGAGRPAAGPPGWATGPSSPSPHPQ